MTMIRSEIVDRYVYDVTSMDDDLFLLSASQPGRKRIVTLYPQNTPIQTVPVMPASYDRYHLASCNVAKCVYVGLRKYSNDEYVIYKLTKADGNVFAASIWLTSKLPDSNIGVSNVGHVIICWSYGENYDAVTRIYNSEGDEIRKIVHSNQIDRKLLKSNDHLLITDRFYQFRI